MKTVIIGLGSSVVDLFTEMAGVPSLIPRSVIFSMYIWNKYLQRQLFFSLKGEGCISSTINQFTSADCKSIFWIKTHGIMNKKRHINCVFKFNLNFLQPWELHVPLNFILLCYTIYSGLFHQHYQHQYS